MAIRFIRWILPLLVVLTIVAFVLLATGTVGAHAAGITPDVIVALLVNANQCCDYKCLYF